MHDASTDTLETQLRGALKDLANLRTALNAHTSVEVIDADGCITQANDKFCEISQYSRGELIGRDHRMLKSGFHPPEFFRDLWHTVTSGRVWQGDVKNRAKDGSLHWLATTIVPIPAESGYPRQFIAIRADITARKSDEERLIHLAAMVDSSSDAIVGQSPGGIITTWNTGAIRLFGYRADEAIGQPVTMLIPPECLADESEILAHIDHGGNASNLQSIRLTKDGRRIDVSITISPIRCPAGHILGACTIARDITEQKNAEAAIRASEERLQTVIENLTEGLIIADLEGTVLHWNRVGREMRRIKNDNFVLKNLDDFHTQYDLRTVEKNTPLPVDEWPFARILRGERLCGVELRVRRLDGRMTGIFRYGGSLVTEPSGRKVAVITFSDVTKRRNNEEELKRLQFGLEQRVLERTQELQVANRELEAFSYSVSHDLRSPLRALDGYSQALLEDYGARLPDEAQRYLGTIRQSAQNMGKLIDNLLSFSRLSRAPINRSAIDVQSLIEQIIRDLAVPATVRIQLSPLLPCEADLPMLRQVWINLIENAIKYSRRRESPVIGIGSIQTPVGAAYRIHDNGTGFDMRYASKLFGVFQRLHRAEDYEGTGVGLAIVQRIVERHGGKVWAEAELGKGASFYFTLQSQKH